MFVFPLRKDRTETWMDQNRACELSVTESTN
jgi:hypothetical protein